jgi:hypothetical protein
LVTVATYQADRPRVMGAHGPGPCCGPRSHVTFTQHKWGRALERRPRGDGSSRTRPAAAGTVAGYRPQEAAPGGASTPTEGLTTRSGHLLMAKENPTGRGAVVALEMPADQVRFLRSVFAMARDGIRDELTDHVDQLREPTHLRREEGAYGRLLTALDELVIVPDDDIRVVAGDLAQTIDQSNEYERVVAEHEALMSLIGQLGDVRGVA